MTEIYWLFIAAFAASALGGVLGMASGIFIVPILTLLFGFNIHAAIGASLISVIACSCASAAPFLRGGLANIRLAIVLETATTLGALTGVFLVRFQRRLCMACLLLFSPFRPSKCSPAAARSLRQMPRMTEVWRRPCACIPALPIAIPGKPLPIRSGTFRLACF